MIELPQGNNAVYLIKPLWGGDIYPLSEGDKIVFSVKPTGYSKSLILRKILDINDFTDYEGDVGYKLEFFPLDTCDLPPLTYRFDCLLILNNGEQYTFIPTSDFKILSVLGKGGKDD